MQVDHADIEIPRVARDPEHHVGVLPRYCDFLECGARQAQRPYRHRGERVAHVHHRQPVGSADYDGKRTCEGHLTAHERVRGSEHDRLGRVGDVHCRKTGCRGGHVGATNARVHCYIVRRPGWNEADQLGGQRRRLGYPRARAATRGQEQREHHASRNPQLLCCSPHPPRPHHHFCPCTWNRCDSHL